MRIILLDLNYTLVANSENKLKPFSRQIEQEEYRTRLIQSFRNDYVILITARPQAYKDRTLDSIMAKTLWMPHEAYFNHLNLRPHIIKEIILKTYLIPRLKTEHMLAIESNPKTRAMYKKYNIKSLTAEEYLEGIYEG